MPRSLASQRFSTPASQAFRFSLRKNKLTSLRRRRTDWLRGRRGGDSNPRRRDCRRNGFRDRRIQPLCHLSAAECIHRTLSLQPHSHPAITSRNSVPLPPVYTITPDLCASCPWFSTYNL